MPNSSFPTPYSLSETPLSLVTIVALCHNHAPFLREALDSILAQTYPNLEVWLVDDASTDGSPAILREYAARNPAWHLLLLPENVGNCQAFNTAFLRSKGEFVIDFATDDVLLPARVAQQVAQFQAAEAAVGVVYSNCELIDEASRSLGLHHRPDAGGQLKPAPASGWVFAEVLRRYFISTPTMMMRRACLESLGGYDETLAYEDFDFWVRASRDWQFLYLDEVTTRKRKHPRSMSARAYRRHDPYLASTIRVCTKALALARTPAERAALAVRLRSELRQAVRRHAPHAEVRPLLALLRQVAARTPLDWALATWSRLRG
ncbi:glycosyltransferase family 2 protein [Hymenobacter sp. DH14]|uniref:Glycosyltransferase family 2 protein n=1 Tax=Hymenobacter cyanobacteriorum TaxID=2926463 RepID=A0A9X1VEF0_9BACT|nr:glycosyltransferase family A protein [Hymenobacter cyanobacteriorum]MCI1187396.1 glycosyltransferase family 2 protein [Hymenobacter cyanobacteriorum]